MRARHIIAVAAVILVGVGAKLIFFTAPTAEADSLPIRSVGLDVSRLQQNVKNLPAQKSHDMSLVFSGADLTAGGVAAATSEEPRQASFTPRCAERDLRAFAVIEEFGQIDAMPSAWLADAGLNWLQARSHCLAGAENQGVILYDRIIAGDARMSNAWTKNEPVRR